MTNLRETTRLFLEANEALHSKNWAPPRGGYRRYMNCHYYYYIQYTERHGVVSIIRYVDVAEDASVVISFSILKQGTQSKMEDRILRGHHSHGALVTEASTVVINNGALYGSKYNLGCPYRADYPPWLGQQTCWPMHVCIDGTL